MKPLLKDLFFSTLLKAGVISLKRLKSDGFYIVTFHRVLPQSLKKLYPFEGLVVTPEELSWFLGVFSNYFTCGSVSELYNEWKKDKGVGRPFLAITFDDGQLDNYEYAKPVLDKYGIKATFYIPTQGVQNREALWHDRLGFAIMFLVQSNAALAHETLSNMGFDNLANQPVKKIVRSVVVKAKEVDHITRSSWVENFEKLVGENVLPKWNNLMTWDLLSKLIEQGHEIGSHSVSHGLLSQLSKDQVAMEIHDSMEIIKSKLNIKVESFCYPNGDYTEYVESVVERAGYNNAVTTKYGCNTGVEDFRLKRFDMVAANFVDRKNNLSLARISWRMSSLHEFMSKR